jgi:16S rRNA (guanine(966)-N(2))-methyltransferase RsmD
MRIISGKYKGRQLQAPTNLPVRPTTDRAKEALFSYLQHRFDFDEMHVLDLFAGTGNISYEFASRGCTSIVAVDQHVGCCRFIKTTAEQLGISGILIQRADVFSWLQRNTMKFDLIFADPPYQLDQLKSLPSLILSQNMLQEDGLFILEHPIQHHFDNMPGFLEARNYGQSVFSIFTSTETTS